MPGSGSTHDFPNTARPAAISNKCAWDGRPSKAGTSACLPCAGGTLVAEVHADRGAICVEGLNPGYWADAISGWARPGDECDVEAFLAAAVGRRGSVRLVDGPALGAAQTDRSQWMSATQSLSAL